MTRLVVELLGGLRVATDGGREIRITSRKAQALLVCLALRPGASHARDHLASLLWDDTDPELARASLRQALTALRRALPPEAVAALVADAQSIALEPSLAGSDVQHFRELLRVGSPAAIAQATERYAGDLLPGFDAHSATFDTWLDEHRRSLRREWSQALQRAAAHCTAAGDTAGTIEALSRLVALEPASEIAQRELIDALSRAGRYTDALRQYRTCVEALRRDLDVAPDPATEALHREVLRRRRGERPLPGDRQDGTDVVDDEVPGPETPVSPALVTTLREVVVLVARIGRARSGLEDDPEAMRERWSRAEERVRGVVDRLGGATDGLTQGELIAAFGLAQSSGNELARAARAAEKLITSADPSDPAEPGLAIGIASGLVLPAASSSAFPIAGQPVVAAQELARAAAPGSVRFAADVAAQLREARQPEGFAGRRAEIAMLETLFERVATTSRGRALVIRGEPGIGKSSLLEALAGWARHRADVFVANLADFGQSATERPGSALAAQLLGVAASAAADVRLAAHRRALETGLLETDEVAAALDLLGVASDGAGERSATDGDDARARARTRLLGRLVARAAASRPILLLVEDVHWADANEIAQLGDVAAAVVALPVLLAVSTRVEGDPITASWRTRARGCPVTTLDLAPLADDEAREVAAGFGDIAPEVLERCIETAAGNPLFLVQLLRSARSGQTAMPGSVRALLLARVERLSHQVQRLLHAAATLGTRFSLDALRHVASVPVLHGNAEVESHGLLVCDGEECRFSHALIRAAVYESLLRSTRRTLHQRAAQWYEGRESAVFAEHLAAAEDPAAVAALLRAAGAELRELRLDRALQHAERALVLAAGDAERCEAKSALGEILLARSSAEEAVVAFREAVALADAPGMRAHARLGLAGALRILDRYDEALQVLTHAEYDAVDEGDARRLGRVWTLRGNLHFPRGAFDDCLRAHQRALELAREAGSPEDVARSLGGLGDAHYQRGRMRTALDHVLRCLQLADQHGLTGLRLAYLPMAAAMRSYCGAIESARAMAQEAAAASQRAAESRTELLACSVGASCDLYLANYDSAREGAERSTALARDLGAGRFETEGLIVTGLACLGGGHTDEAVTLLEEAAARARSTAATYCGPWALAALASTVADPGRCRALLAEGERLLAQGSLSHNHLEFRMLAIESMLAARDWSAARHHAQALAAYTREEPLPWSDLVIARAQALATAGKVVRARASVGRTRELQELQERTRNMGFTALLPALQAALDRVG